jgi:hypothetical protein
VEIKSTPLAEVLHFLESKVEDDLTQVRETSYYAFSIKAESKIQAKLVNLKYENATLQSILEDLALQVSGRIEIRGSEIVLRLAK